MASELKTEAQISRRGVLALGAAAGASAALMVPGRADAASIAYQQSVAIAAEGDEALLKFYAGRGYKGIWTTTEDRARRKALVEAFTSAGDHGLPTDKYDPERLVAKMRAVRTARDRGQLEGEMSKLFLDFVHDIQSGILEPHTLGKDVGLKAPRRDPLKTLEAFALSTPAAFIAKLPPQNAKYARLMKERIRLQNIVKNGGWGPQVRARKIEPGDTGADVVALRNRLVRMGYMRPSVSRTYDSQLQVAVQTFQHAHGLFIDPVVGNNTLTALNAEPLERLQQVTVGLERMRWFNKPLGDRHIWVNQADYHFRFYDHGRVTFDSRVVVGQVRHDLQTAEFTDLMTHMVINPSWHVPESIMVKEYLPKFRNNPGALSREGIILSDARGVVDPSTIDFAEVGSGNWRFSMRQPPGPRNALGRVKFLFPNKFNIYMHDTPSRSLFERETRAYSHGCVRVHKPLEFAYHLLGLQTPNPKSYFHSIFDTGQETEVYLDTPIPVHLTYTTAWIDDDGIINYRDDVYGRDQRIWDQLKSHGVALGLAAS